MTDLYADSFGKRVFLMSSDFLFVMPNFWRGVGSVLDVAGTAESGNYNTYATPVEADIRAIAADWLAVGHDINAAIREVDDDIRSEG